MFRIEAIGPIGTGWCTRPPGQDPRPIRPKALVHTIKIISLLSMKKLIFFLILKNSIYYFK